MLRDFVEYIEESDLRVVAAVFGVPAVIFLCIALLLV
jgi:hypothetical protein